MLMNLVVPQNEEKFLTEAVCMRLPSKTLLHGVSLLATYTSNPFSICIHPLFLEISRHKMAVDYNNSRPELRISHAHFAMSPITLAIRCVHCALRNTLCALRSTLCALRSTLCAFRSTLCALRNTQCALRSTLCALSNTLCALRNTLCAQIHKFKTIKHNSINKRFKTLYESN